MSNVHHDIVSWLHKQKNWLQVAAEKIIYQEELSDEDIRELSRLLKTDEGQRDDFKRDFSTFISSDQTHEQLRINSIGDVIGIDNLAPRTPLQFGEGNLTIVYGNNGSGKSGYTRILKKVCGKPNADQLKSNVFKPVPSIQHCTIAYSADGIPLEEVWIANSEAIDALIGVDIFDSHIGKLYLEKESDAAYIPETVALFEELVVVCKRVKKLLEAEKGILQSKLPKIPLVYIKTKYGTTLATKLKAGIDEEKLKVYFNYTEEDMSNQASLEERLKDAPTILARHKRQHIQQLESLVNAVNAAVKKVNADACGKIFQLQQDAKNKRKIAMDGASAIVDKAILPGIGTKTWMALWEAAKEYSISGAYPEKKFPKIDNDSLCVLCHQSLDAEAKQRLHDFEAFVNSTLEADAEKAEKDYKNTLDDLPYIAPIEQLKTSLQAAHLDEDVWLLVFNEIWGNIQQVSNELIKDHNAMLTGYTLPDEVFKPIVDLTKSIDEQIQQHDSDAENFDKEQLTKELNDLKAKQWASGYIDAIIEEVVRLEEIQSYEQWLEFTNPRAISIKAGDVSKKVITEAYIDRFNSELISLGAKNIKVELVKTRVEHGKVKGDGKK